MLDEKAQKLNDKQFKITLPAPGTDLTLGLLKVTSGYLLKALTLMVLHLSLICQLKKSSTAPDTNVMDGYVTSTKPLSYAGSTIEGIKVTFADGKIVDVTADKGSKS